jgi:hypothetical protein
LWDLSEQEDLRLEWLEQLDFFEEWDLLEQECFFDLEQLECLEL